MASALHWFSTMMIATPLTWLLAATAVGAPAPPEAPAAEALTIDAAVTRALARNPALLAEGHAVRAAEAGVAQAASSRLPRVGLEAWYRFSGPLPELTLDTGVTLPGQPEPLVVSRELGDPHSAGALLKVGWRAWDFGARDALVDAGRAMVRSARASGDGQAVELAYATRAAYLAALYAADALGATERALATARDLLADATRRRDAGLASAVAVAAADDRVAELEARRAEAHAASLRARATLALWLALPTDAVALADDLDGARLALAGAAGPARHPSLRQLEALDAALSRQRDAVADGRLPTVDLFAQLGYQSPVTFVSEEAGVVYAAGVQLAWTLYDGGLAGARRDELAARRAELRERERATEEHLERQRADAETAAAAAREVIVAASRRVEAAEVTLRAARRGVDVGVAVDLDARQAEVRVDLARLALARARYDSALAEAARLRARGAADISPGLEVAP